MKLRPHPGSRSAEHDYLQMTGMHRTPSIDEYARDLRDLVSDAFDKVFLRPDGVLAYWRDDAGLGVVQFDAPIEVRHDVLYRHMPPGFDVEQTAAEMIAARESAGGALPDA